MPKILPAILGKATSEIVQKIAGEINETNTPTKKFCENLKNVTTVPVTAKTICK